MCGSNLRQAQVVTAAQSPRQNPYVERVIGSIRRECLTHGIIFDECHLRGVPSSYFHHYHRTRTHLSLDTFPEVGGLHHRYEHRAASPPISRRIRR